MRYPRIRRCCHQSQPRAARRLQAILEEDLDQNQKFDNKDYMTYFTLVYNMCTQKPPHNYSEQLYQRYKKAIADYLNSSVLPAVREKSGQYMLKEVGKRWSHHKINVKWMAKFFSYLVRSWNLFNPLPPHQARSACAGSLSHEAPEFAVHAGSWCVIAPPGGGWERR